MNFWRKTLAVLFAGMLFAAAVPTTLATQYGSFTSSADFSELQIQVAMANGLAAHEYTAQSWAPLQKALDEGKDILKAGVAGQKTIDSTVEAIQKAIPNLVEMDYTYLEDTIRDVYYKIDENPELNELWIEMGVSLDHARALLISGDQESVDAAVIELNNLLEQLAHHNTAVPEPEIIFQEVEVEVMPSGDYCNIPMHRTWPVLFAVSAALNGALIVMLIFVLAHKRRTEDNTPLVSYDIEDDMDF